MTGILVIFFIYLFIYFNYFILFGRFFFLGAKNWDWGRGGREKCWISQASTNVPSFYFGTYRIDSTHSLIGNLKRLAIWVSGDARGGGAGERKNKQDVKVAKKN